MKIARPTVTKSFVTLSIQASADHYCTPRNNVGPYTHMEVGFISDLNGNRITPPDSWREYADGAFPNDVYAYVPVQLINEFIQANGGKVGEVEKWER